MFQSQMELLCEFLDVKLTDSPGFLGPLARCANGKRAFSEYCPSSVRRNQQ
jgi:hypothetical protein